jgi:hypothetical protein
MRTEGKKGRKEGRKEVRKGGNKSIKSYRKKSRINRERKSGETYKINKAVESMFSIYCTNQMHHIQRAQ